MDIEIKKNERGENMCAMISRRARGTTVNLNELFYYLGDWMVGNEIIKDLNGLGLRYSIHLLSTDTDETSRKEGLDDLLNIALLTTALKESISCEEKTNSDIDELTQKQNDLIESLRNEYASKLEKKRFEIARLKTIIRSHEAQIEDQKNEVSEKSERIQNLNREIEELKTGKPV